MQWHFRKSSNVMHIIDSINVTSSKQVLQRTNNVVSRDPHTGADRSLDQVVHQDRKIFKIRRTNKNRKIPHHLAPSGRWTMQCVGPWSLVNRRWCSRDGISWWDHFELLWRDNFTESTWESQSETAKRRKITIRDFWRSLFLSSNPHNSFLTKI